MNFFWVDNILTSPKQFADLLPEDKELQRIPFDPAYLKEWNRQVSNDLKEQVEKIHNDFSQISEQHLQNNFDHFTPAEFEKMIAKLFESMGYAVEDLPHVGDFGADILAKAGSDVIVIQVKKWNANVGAPEIQKTLGAIFKYKANRAIVVTTADFTDAAKEQAQDTPLELWNKNLLHEKVRRYLLTKNPHRDGFSE